jgi:hypothetical protein
MKKQTLFLFLFLLIGTTQAQNFIGAHYSTKDAIITNSLNPAMPVAGDVKWQVNLLGINANIGNNYFGLNSLKGIAKNFDTETSLVEILDGKRKNMHVNLGFNGPAGFVRIKKDNAISFGVRGRAVATVNDMNQDLVYSLYNNFENILEWIPAFEDERASGAVNAYHEIYAGYSRTLNFGTKHALHLGVNVKLITNVFNAQFDINNLDFNKIVTSPTDSFINVGNTNFNFLVSDRIDDGFKYKFGINGFGIDLGGIYELKKEGSNDHFLLLGFSANDIGKNSYTLGKNSRTFVGNNTNVNANDLVDGDGNTINIDQVLDKLGTKTTPTGKHKMNLPTTLNLFTDIRIVKMLYANANFQFNPYSFKKGEPKANMPDNITITPRFETRVFSAYLPINWNKYSGFNAGAAIRLGQFTIGSSNVITAFIKKPVTGMDIYMNIGFGKIAKSTKVKKAKKEKIKEDES